MTPEEKLLGVIKKSQHKQRLKKELRLFTRVNILLIVLVFILAAVFLINIFTSGHNMPEFIVELPEYENTVLPVSDNLDDEGLLDIKVEKEEVSIAIQEIVKNLSVLGIVTGDNNQAIIEDKSSKKVFFLYKGDNFENFTVNDIKDDEVILDYEGEEVELKI